MDADRRAGPHRPWRRVGPGLAALVLVALTSGCGLVATPRTAPTVGGPLAPPGPVGYVVCPAAVTPVELTTDTAEAPIALPVTGTPAFGDTAIATSPDGRAAYVVTTVGPAGAARTAAGNVLIPIDLVTQRAGRPIPLPGSGGTHAVVVLPGGHIVLAASGTSIVPVDAGTRAVGAPLDLGPGRTVYGMALSASGPTLWVLVPGGVVPVDTSRATAGALVPTGLTISSVTSPHGLVVTPDGATVYVVGQGGADFGGRVVPVTAATGAVQPATGFDRYGIADPAAVALTADGTQLLVADSANDWIVPVSLAAFGSPGPPVPLPTGGAAGGHPSDIVVGPGTTGAFVVEGYGSVVPYAPATRTFGRPVRVCSGASSMAVAQTP